jgi:hypothetical protein
MSNASVNSSRATHMSGIATLNYSSDFPSSEPRHGGGGNAGLMPPPLRKKPTGRVRLNHPPGTTAPSAAATAAPSSHLANALSPGFASLVVTALSANDSFNTPTFGHLPKFATTKLPGDLSSVRMKLDMSSPSLFVLSPAISSLSTPAGAGQQQQQNDSGNTSSTEKPAAVRQQKRVSFSDTCRLLSRL